MSDWTDVGALDDFAPGTVTGVDAGGESFIVVRTEAGAVTAYEDRCSHLDLPMDRARLAGNRLICPWHGACFDAATGEAMELPAVDPLEQIDSEVVDERVRIRP